MKTLSVPFFVSLLAAAGLVSPLPASAQPQPKGRAVGRLACPALLSSSEEFAKYWQAKKTPAAEACLRNAVKRRPQIGGSIALTMLRLGGSDARTREAAEKLATLAPNDADRIPVDLTLATASVQAGDTAKASAVYQRLARSAKDPSVVSLAARGAARIERASGNEELAAKLLNEAIERDPSSISAVRELVVLVEHDDALALCHQLATTRHTGQALECLRARKLDYFRSQGTWMRVCSDMPRVDMSLIKEWPDPRGGFNPLKGVQMCDADPGKRFGKEAIDDAEDGRLPVVYSKLSDSIRSSGFENAVSKATCLESFAAWTCIGSVLKNEDCALAEAPARYAVSLYERNERPELDRYLEDLLFEKGGLYNDLARQENPNTKRTLFQLHVSLANIYSKVGDGPFPFQKTNYHVERATAFWKELEPNGDPKILELMLPRKE